MMKKYKVTDKHPSIKVGVQLEYESEDVFWYINTKTHDFVGEISAADLEKTLNSGWIEEIQEPEFTRSDMIRFALKCTIEWQKCKSVHYENELTKYQNEK